MNGAIYDAYVSAATPLTQVLEGLGAAGRIDWATTRSQELLRRDPQRGVGGVFVASLAQVGRTVAEVDAIRAGGFALVALEDLEAGSIATASWRAQRAQLWDEVWRPFADLVAAAVTAAAAAPEQVTATEEPPAPEPAAELLDAESAAPRPALDLAPVLDEDLARLVGLLGTEVPEGPWSLVRVSSQRGYRIEGKDGKPVLAFGRHSQGGQPAWDDGEGKVVLLSGAAATRPEVPAHRLHPALELIMGLPGIVQALRERAGVMEHVLARVQDGAAMLDAITAVEETAARREGHQVVFDRAKWNPASVEALRRILGRAGAKLVQDLRGGDAGLEPVAEPQA